MVTLKNCNQRSGGFSLVEMLVVVAIIGLLIGLTIPAVQSVRLAAQRTYCANNLRQIGLGLLSYESAHQSFPAGVTWHQAQGRFRQSSWLFHLLPFIEQSSQSEAGQQEWNAGIPFYRHAGFQSVVPAYQCPTDPRSGSPQWTHEELLAGLTSYVGVVGTDYTTKDGVLFQDSEIHSSDIHDGLSQTLLVGERPASSDNWYGWWYGGTGQLHLGIPSGSPDMLLGARERNDSTTYAASTCPPGPYSFSSGRLDDPSSLFHFWSLHQGGGQFVLCDGSVHFVPYTVESTLIPAMATRAGEEVASLDSN